MKYLDSQKLPQLAAANKEIYQANSPFPHIVLDDFLKNPDEIHNVFPSTDNFSFYEYKSPFEDKLAFDKISVFPQAIADVLQELNSPDFLIFLEQLTGIDGLIPDPYLRGGGIHQTKKNGKLDIHIDFNIHPKLKLDRRLNIIVYLNKNWQNEWKGDLQFWEGKKVAGKHILIKLEKRIYPAFNRLLVFSTSEKSYHGHPEPLDCPENITRNSLALYYYTKDRKDESCEPHSTSYVKLPNEDDTLDDLREKRNQARLNTTMAGNNPPK